MTQLHDAWQEWSTWPPGRKLDDLDGPGGATDLAAWSGMRPLSAPVAAAATQIALIEMQLAEAAE